jgi:hypothetical protein
VPLDRQRLELVRRLHHSPCFAHLRGRLFEIVGRLSGEICLPEMIECLVEHHGGRCRVCGAPVRSRWYDEPHQRFTKLWLWGLEVDQLLCDGCEYSLGRWRAAQELPAGPDVMLTWLSSVVAKRPKRVLAAKAEPEEPLLLADARAAKSRKRHERRLEERRDRLERRVLRTVVRHYSLDRCGELTLQSVLISAGYTNHPWTPARKVGAFGVPRVTGAATRLKNLGLLKRFPDGHYLPTVKIWTVYRRHKICAWEPEIAVKALRLYDPSDEVVAATVRHLVPIFRTGRAIPGRDSWVVEWHNRRGEKFKRVFTTKYEFDMWLSAAREVSQVRLDWREREIPWALSPKVRANLARGREVRATNLAKKQAPLFDEIDKLRSGAKPKAKTKQTPLARAALERRRKGATPAEIAKALDITPLQVRHILGRPGARKPRQTKEPDGPVVSSDQP